MSFEQEVELLMECYHHLNLSLEDAKGILKIENEDFQNEILEIMEEFNFSFKEAKNYLS